MVIKILVFLYSNNPHIYMGLEKAELSKNVFLKREQFYLDWALKLMG